MDSVTPTPVPARFHEMASALQELGFSEQEMANTEVTARDLVRAGWAQASAEMAVIRMRRRNEVLADLEQMLRRSLHVEEWIRAVTVESPPPWRRIFALTWSLLWMRWKDIRRS